MIRANTFFRNSIAASLLIFWSTQTFSAGAFVQSPSARGSLLSGQKFNELRKGSSNISEMTAPAIISLSVGEGTFAEEVVIKGTGFGDTIRGQVHFFFPPDKELMAYRIDRWTNGLIEAAVPRMFVPQAIAGNIYVVRPGMGKSNAVPFTYKPEIGYSTLKPRYATNDDSSRHMSQIPFFGDKQDEEFL